MKKAMVAFMKALAEDDYQILEEIIESKYEKFTELYWVLKDYSDYIAYMKYKTTSKDILKIELKISGVDVETVLDGIQSSISDSDGILIWNAKKRIHIEITKDESSQS